MIRRLLPLSLLAAGLLPASTVLYSIGSDSNGVANQLVRIDVGGQTTSVVTTLGNGSTSYAGGLFADGSSFQGFEADNLGALRFAAYDTSGNVMVGSALGFASAGGLTYSSSGMGAKMWIANDSFGASTLESTGNPLSLGYGFNGGLAYRSVDELLYAIGNDGYGHSTLYSIDAMTLAVTALALSLGDGFYGGLAWDPSSDQFYAIGADSNGLASLYRFQLGDLSAAPLFTLGYGFGNAGLTVGLADETPGAAVPEPSTMIPLVIAGVALYTRRRRSRA